MRLTLTSYPTSSLLSYLFVFLTPLVSLYPPDDVLTSFLSSFIYLGVLLILHGLLCKCGHFDKFGRVV